MSEDFLSRWSKRKAEVRRSERNSPPKSERAAEPALSPEELAMLPKLDELTANSDITGFLRAGVPEGLRNAALRKMWMLDPAIRDFVGPARDYSYDWNAPAGVPGNSPLEPEQVAALLRRVFGEPERPAEPEKAGAAEHEPEPASGQAGPKTSMRSGIIAVLCGASALVATTAIAQTAPAASPNAATATAQPKSAPADLCQELLAFAEMKRAQPPTSSGGQASAPAAAAPPRGEGKASDTQGGGSVNQSSSADTRSQPAAPPTAPVATGAAAEAASSPHASGPPDGDKLPGDLTLQQVRENAGRGDRETCRETVQTLRHAGAVLPAPLIALAAYEPDPDKRQ